MDYLSFHNGIVKLFCYIGVFFIVNIDLRIKRGDVFGRESRADFVEHLGDLGIRFEYAVTYDRSEIVRRPYVLVILEQCELILGKSALSGISRTNVSSSFASTWYFSELSYTLLDFHFSSP